MVQFVAPGSVVAGRAEEMRVLFSEVKAAVCVGPHSNGDQEEWVELDLKRCPVDCLEPDLAVQICD